MLIYNCDLLISKGSHIYSCHCPNLILTSSKGRMILLLCPNGWILEFKDVIFIIYKYICSPWLSKWPCSCFHHLTFLAPKSPWSHFKILQEKYTNTTWKCSLSWHLKKKMWHFYNSLFYTDFKYVYSEKESWKLALCILRLLSLAVNLLPVEQVFKNKTNITHCSALEWLSQQALATMWLIQWNIDMINSSVMMSWSRPLNLHA